MASALPTLDRQPLPHPIESAQTSEKPRERLLAYGSRALTTAELLAIILRTGIAGCSNIALAHMLLQQFGGLRGLLAAQAKDLLPTRGLGTAKVCELQAISELHRRALEGRPAQRSGHV